MATETLDHELGNLKIRLLIGYVKSIKQMRNNGLIKGLANQPAILTAPLVERFNDESREFWRKLSDEAT